MKVENLRLEYLRNPVATDNKRPRFSWTISSSKPNTYQVSYRILVSSSVELLKNQKGDIWDSKEIFSGNTLDIEYGGKPLKPYKKYYWAVIVKNNHIESEISEIASFGTGILGTKWKGKWIGIKEARSVKKNAGSPSPYLYKAFETENKKIKSATLYATAKGVYKVKINGEYISNAEFCPGWTNYNKRIYYQGYDVKPFLQNGENALGVILGDGWFFGNLSAVGRNQYGKYPRLFTAYLLIEYTDGTKTEIITDKSWSGKTGPIVYSDIQTGEFYDANLEIGDFATLKMNTSGFKPVLTKPVKENLLAQIGEPVEKIEEIIPSSYNKIKGKYIFDMGQNMVGRVRLAVKGQKGQKIKLRFGEMLNTDKTLYTDNLRSAEVTDYYVCKGEGEEVWEPLFTFHGFRYVEVTGIDYTPSLDLITGVVIHTNCEVTSSFSSSDVYLNKLYKNALWGQKGNFLSVPTDCPQRDERLGWTGDSEIFAQTGCYNMYSAGFYEKYIYDMLDEQRENGAFTDIAPYIFWPDGRPLVGYANAAWADAGVIMPYLIYRMYNNKQILENSFDAICRYIECLKASSEGFIRSAPCYGDWLAVGEPVPFDILDTAYFAYSTILASKIAEIIDNKEKADEYKKLFDNIKAAFNKVFINKDGKMPKDTQTGYVLALKFGLVEGETKQKVVKSLIAAIEKANWHLTTGFVGVSYLLPVLCDNGYPDVAYRILKNKTYPSWNYSILNGATTIWERWNSYTLEDGFADIRMNSFNHYSLGSVIEWVVEYIGGIKRNKEKVGYYDFEICPFTDGLDFASVSYNSPNGMIKSSWKKVGRGYEIEVSVPANTTCVLKLTANEDSDINETLNFENLTEDLGYLSGRRHFKLVSGKYKFKVDL